MSPGKPIKEGKLKRKAGDHQDLRTYRLAAAENERVTGSNMSLLRMKQ
jgi:hypothetical protein